MFYQGLKGQIETISAYKHDPITDYDISKIEGRKIVRRKDRLTRKNNLNLKKLKSYYIQSTKE